MKTRSRLYHKSLFYREHCCYSQVMNRALRIRKGAIPDNMIIQGSRNSIWCNCTLIYTTVDPYTEEFLRFRNEGILRSFIPVTACVYLFEQ